MLGFKAKKLVSVIVPSYNHERYIGEAINSVLKQSYANLELIIVDDGSMDNSVEIIRGFSDDRITVYVQENAGAHQAINRGIESSQGEYLAILNSDDQFKKNRLKTCVTRLEKDGNIGLVSTWLEIIDDEGEKLAIKKGWENMEPWPMGDRSKSFYKTGDYALNLLASNFVSTTSNMVFRRSVYDQVGGMRPLRFAHDWDFMLRVASQFECEQLEKPLIRYRIHDSNTISSDRAWMLFEICWVMAANLSGYYARHLFTDPELTSDTDTDQLGMLYESLNFQGNDKLVWLMVSYMESLRQRGISDPADRILTDEGLREFFVSKVIA